MQAPTHTHTVTPGIVIHNIVKSDGGVPYCPLQKLFALASPSTHI